MEQITPLTDKLLANVEKVIIGKHDALQKTMLALLVQGHVLIEDVPGVGKTMLARTIARSIGCIFKRIQFTPDMLPSDVTGVSVFNQRDREFEFREGPIFAQIVLVDEINRATPKTQSALLEAMEERQVTVDGQSTNTIQLRSNNFIQPQLDEYTNLWWFYLAPTGVPGTGTEFKISVMIWSVSTFFIRAAGLIISRWASAGSASALISSGIT